jgi:hypothetical protein
LPRPQCCPSRRWPSVVALTYLELEEDPVGTLRAPPLRHQQGW